MGFGYQWFGITSLDPERMKAGVAQAAVALDDFIADMLAARGLGVDQLALAGFSQGSMMSLDRALRLGGSKATVAFSGMVANPQARLAPDAVRQPILLVHGTADTVVPFSRMAEAESALTRAGFPVETQICPGLGHGIDQAGANRAVKFLVRHLGDA
jgi:phospholipase/carboxylesterase